MRLKFVVDEISLKLGDTRNQNREDNASMLKWCGCTVELIIEFDAIDKTTMESSYWWQWVFAIDKGGDELTAAHKRPYSWFTISSLCLKESPVLSYDSLHFPFVFVIYRLVNQF